MSHDEHEDRDEQAKQPASVQVDGDVEQLPEIRV